MSNQPNWTAYYKLDRLAMSLDTQRFAFYRFQEIRDAQCLLLSLISATKNSYSFIDFVAAVASESSERALWQKDVEIISLFCFVKTVLSASLTISHFNIKRLRFWHGNLKGSVPRNFYFNQLLLYLSYLCLYLSFQTSRRKQDQENPWPFSGIPCNTWGVVS